MKRPLDCFDNTPPVESGVPLPLAQRGKPENYRYPWDTMKVGDSFLVPCAAERVNQRQTEVLGCVRYRIRTNAPTERYTTRRVKGGIRVWRTA